MVDLAIGLGIPFLQMTLRKSHSFYLHFKALKETYRIHCPRSPIRHLGRYRLLSHNGQHTGGVPSQLCLVDRYWPNLSRLLQ